MKSTLMLVLGLFLAACSSSRSFSAESYRPRMVLVPDGARLPEDLQSTSAPEVRLLLRGNSDEEIEIVESEMSRRGFWLITRLGHDCPGVAELRFFGGFVEVLHTQLAEHCWIASETLWEEGLPFGWGTSQGDYLFVPAAFADRARELLKRDDRIRGRVIDADGRLIQDRMLPNSAQQPARPEARG